MATKKMANGGPLPAMAAPPMLPAKRRAPPRMAPPARAIPPRMAPQRMATSAPEAIMPVRAMKIGGFVSKPKMRSC